MANVKKQLRKTYINQNPQDYFNLAADRAGLGTGGGVQPFHEWVKNSGYEQAARGYSNMLVDRPKLGFGKYMKKAYGVPAKKSAMKPQPNGGGPINTGNAFTSSSGAGPKWGAGQALGAGQNAAPLQNFANQMRMQFLRLTPEQAGTYSAGYSMGPSRWSVFG